MKRTPRNIIYHELIGLSVEVKDHTDPSIVGTEGEVIYESKNMLFIRDRNGRIRKVPKAVGEFLFKLGKNRSVRVNGLRLIGRPEERLKRVRGVLK
jgi:ribonuclease P protein subunit POP4